MSELTVYAIYFQPQALDTLGDTIKPYLLDGPAGPHVLSSEIDAGGPLFEMSLMGKDAAGKPVEVEVMVPLSMIRIVIAAKNEEFFGFATT